MYQDAEDAKVSISHAKYKDFYLGAYSQINTKNKKVSIHIDRSGSMDVYAGKTDEDYQVFKNGSLVNCKLRGEKKVHLH